MKISSMKLLLFLIMASLFGSVQPVNAQSLSQGIKEYQRNDFIKAERTFTSLTKKRLPSPKKAQSFKYLGICQYLLGKKGLAKTSFENAVRLSPKTTISSNEVLDPSVVTFFDAVKKGANANTANKNRRIIRRDQPQVGEKAKLTVVKIDANTSAQLFKDGILIGETGRFLEVDPGVSIFDATAKGYKKKSFKLNVVANQQNTVTISLEKIPPPSPKRIAQPRKGVPAVATKSSQEKRSPVTPKVSNDIFGDDPMEEDIPSQPVSPGGNRNLANEFNLDTAYGNYPQQPSYQQPYSPQPYVQQPVYPQPYMQQPMPYYAPPQPYVPPAPPMPPVQPVYEQPESAAPPAYYNQDPYSPGAPQPRRSRRTKSPKKTNPLMNLLPLGIPQYTQDKPILGTLFLGGQLGLTYLWYSKNQDAENTANETNDFINDFAKKRDTLSSEKIEEAESYINDNNDYIDQQRQEAQMAIIGAAALYAASVTEAFLFPQKIKTKRKKRRSRYGEFSPPGPNNFTAEVRESTFESRANYDFFVLPHKNKNTYIVLNLELKL